MKQQYLKNTATLTLDSEKCVGCGMCMIVCPHHVFEPLGKKVKIADIDGCMECGACSLNCAVSAISVKPGVGCAAAIINGILTGKEPSCECSGGDCC